MKRHYAFSGICDRYLRIVAKRQQRGLSRKRLVKVLGFDENTLARWERGETRPYGRRLSILEQFLTSEV